MKLFAPAASPLPTAAPSAALLAKVLDLRQYGAQTCGYLGGDPEDPMTCDLGYTCAIDARYSVQGCCPESGACTLVTGCYDYYATCDSNCQNDPFVGICPMSSPYCFLQTFDDGNYAVGCTTDPGITQTILAEPLGVTNTIVQSSAPATFSDSPKSSSAEPSLHFSVATQTTMVTVPGATTGPLSSPSSPSTSPSPSATPVPASSSSGSSSGISGTTIAEIVAPVVVGLAAIAAFIWWLVWYSRRRRNSNNNQAVYVPPTVPDHAFPGYGGNSYHNGGAAGAYGGGYGKEAGTVTESAVSSPTLTSHAHMR